MDENEEFLNEFFSQEGLDEAQVPESSQPFSQPSSQKATQAQVPESSQPFSQPSSQKATQRYVKQRQIFISYITFSSFQNVKIVKTKVVG